jgi:short-subunit dehydrogenase
MRNTPTERTALVTGASAGIGEAFARELARQGWDLIVTARRAHRLEALAQELREQRQVKVHVVTGDLADPAMPGQLVQEIHGAGLRVDMLVNNAGYAVGGQFIQSAWQAHADFIQVLVTTVAHLTHLILPGMKERGYGRVINVASLAGLLPGSSGHTMYAAAKAFVIKLTESLSLELQGTGVQLLATCPGFTFSEFHDVLGNRALVSQVPSAFWTTAEEVVRQSLEAIERGQIVVVPGPVNKAIVSAVKLMPNAAAVKLMGRASRSTRRQ